MAWTTRPHVGASLAGSVVHASGPAMLLNLLGLLFVQMREAVACLPVHMEQFVELRVKRLRVPVFRPLDYERHHPSGERRDRMPIEALVVEYEPPRCVEGYDPEREGVGRVDPEVGERLSDADHPEPTGRAGQGSGSSRSRNPA